MHTLKETRREQGMDCPLSFLGSKEVTACPVAFFMEQLNRHKAELSNDRVVTTEPWTGVVCLARDFPHVFSP